MNGSRADGSTNNAKASTGKAGKPESKGLIGQLSRLGSKMSMTPRPPIDPKAPVYDGPLVDGKAFGKGVCTWSNGDQYDGEWQNSCMHGRGVYVWKNKGCRYEGDYVDGLMHGEGEFRSNDDGVYKGGFKDGMKDGTGRWEVTGHQVYVGEYKCDKRHGSGVLKLADGSRYEGQWSEGKFHGQGVWTWNDGRQFQGLFDRDFPVEGLMTCEVNGTSRTQSVQWDRHTRCMVPVGSSSPKALNSFEAPSWSGFTLAGAGGGEKTDMPADTTRAPSVAASSRSCFQLPFNAAERGIPETHTAPSGFPSKYCSMGQDYDTHDTAPVHPSGILTARSSDEALLVAGLDGVTKRPNRVCPMLGF